MNTPVKLLIGIGSLSGIAGGSYFLNQHLSKETIAQKLEKDKYQILVDSHGAWGEIFKEYEKVHAETNNKFKFESATISKKEDLQNECKAILSKTDAEADIYKKAKKWCTVPKTLKVILEEQGYEALNTEDSKDTQTKDKWDPKIELHNDKSKNKGKRFTNLGGDGDPNVNKDQNGRNKIRASCKSLEEKKHYEKDFESNLDKSMLWCANKKTSSN